MRPLVLTVLNLALTLNLLVSSLLSWVPFLMPAATGLPFMDLVASSSGGQDLWGRMKSMPFKVLLKTWLGINNSLRPNSGLFSG